MLARSTSTLPFDYKYRVLYGLAADNNLFREWRGCPLPFDYYDCYYSDGQ